MKEYKCETFWTIFVEILSICLCVIHVVPSGAELPNVNSSVEEIYSKLLTEWQTVQQQQQKTAALATTTTTTTSPIQIDLVDVVKRLQERYKYYNYYNVLSTLSPPQFIQDASMEQFSGFNQKLDIMTPPAPVASVQKGNSGPPVQNYGYYRPTSYRQGIPQQPAFTRFKPQSSPNAFRWGMNSYSPSPSTNYGNEDEGDVEGQEEADPEFNKGVGFELAKDAAKLFGLKAFKGLKILKFIKFLKKAKFFGLIYFAFKSGLLLSPVVLPIILPITLFGFLLNLIPLLIITNLLVKLVRSTRSKDFLDGEVKQHQYYDRIAQITTKVLRSEECTEKISCNVENNRMNGTTTTSVTTTSFSWPSATNRISRILRQFLPPSWVAGWPEEFEKNENCRNIVCKPKHKLSTDR